MLKKMHFLCSLEFVYFTICKQLRVKQTFVLTHQILNCPRPKRLLNVEYIPNAASIWISEIVQIQNRGDIMTSGAILSVTVQYVSLINAAKEINL